MKEIEARWIAKIVTQPSKKLIQVEVVLASVFDELQRAYSDLRDENARTIGNNQVLRVRADDYWRHLMRIMDKHNIPAKELLP